MARVGLAKRVVVGGARAVAGTVGSAANVAGYSSQGRQSYDDTLRTLSEASVERFFNAFRDVAWDEPEMALDLDDDRWALAPTDPIGRHPWYRSLPRQRQLEIGRHRLTAMMKTGSQFEQLLLLGGTHFLLGLPNQNPEFRYFMHELTEECHHIQMFQEFTNRACPDVVGAPRWLMRGIPLVGHFGSWFPALFFAIILAGEEPIDYVQKETLRTGGLHPLMDRIMSIHAAEEARHIGFAHAWLRQHAPHLDPASRFLVGALTPLAMRLGADAILIPSKADRELMGIPDEVIREAFETGPEAAKFRRDLFADVRMLFDEIGLRGASTRWAWQVLGVDGRPARFRAEPRSAAA